MHLVINLASGISQTFYLEKAYYTVGRHSSCDISISGDRHISRVHCTFVVAEEGGKTYCLLIDGNLRNESSSNGTWVNGKRVTKTRLEHQDVITLGPSLPKITFYIDTTEGGDTSAYEFE